MLNIYLVSKGHGNSSSRYWLLENGESVMKGEPFIVLDSRIDAVIGLINLLLKPSQLGLRRRGDPGSNIQRLECPRKAPINHGDFGRADGLRRWLSHHRVISFLRSLKPE